MVEVDLAEDAGTGGAVRELFLLLPAPVLMLLLLLAADGADLLRLVFGILVFAEFSGEQFNGCVVDAGVDVALFDVDIVFAQEFHCRGYSHIEVFCYFTDLSAHILWLVVTM